VDITMQQEQALGIARLLIKAGMPVFLAAPNPASKHGFDLPGGWQMTEPDTAVIDAWRPGMALCAVTGRTLDLVDIDAYSGGSELNVPMPHSYLTAQTPSGGRHHFVRTLGVESLDGKVAPGVDVKSGTMEGHGRGFAFIAPTVRRSKADGIPREYRWVIGPEGPVLPTPDALAADGSGTLLRARVLEIRRASASAAQRTVPESVARREWDATCTRLTAKVAHWSHFGWGGEAHADLLAITTNLARLSPDHAEAAFLHAFRAGGAEPDHADLSKLYSAIEKAVPDHVVPDAQLGGAEAFFLGGEAPPAPFGMGPSLPPGGVFAPPDAPGQPNADGAPSATADDVFAPVTRDRFRNRQPPPPAVYGAFGGAVPLFYASGVHWLQGESESGKTWVALAVVADVLRRGDRALIVDYEDTMDRVLERLEQLGVSDDEIERLTYVDGHSVTFAAITQHVASVRYECLVIDGVTSALTSAGLKGRDEQEMTLWCDYLPRRAAMAICIDHVVKSKDDRGGMAIGSQAKKSVVTGSSFEVICVEKFGRGSDGEIRLNLQKDKPGALRGAGVKSIKLMFSSTADGRVTLARPGKAGASPQSFFDTSAAEFEARVADVLAIVTAYYAAGGTSKASVRALVPTLRHELNVTAKNDVLRAAIQRYTQGLGMPVQMIMPEEGEDP
jgi:hypothetical protein